MRRWMTRTNAHTALLALTATGALLAGINAVRAAPGGATREALSFAGTLTGTSSSQRLTFRFKHGAKEVCAPEVVTTPDADGRFRAEVPLDDCPASLFDGSDVVLDVDVGSTVVARDQAVTPVPYAKYADRIGKVEGDLLVGGKVGIGEDQPDYGLVVAGAGPDLGELRSSGATARLRLNATDAANGGLVSIESTEGGKVNVVAGGNDRLTITPAGLVGIGTGSPSRKLHVKDGSVMVEDHVSGEPSIFLDAAVSTGMKIYASQSSCETATGGQIAAYSGRYLCWTAY